MLRVSPFLRPSASGWPAAGSGARTIVLVPHHSQENTGVKGLSLAMAVQRSVHVWVSQLRAPTGPALSDGQCSGKIQQVHGTSVVGLHVASLQTDPGGQAFSLSQVRRVAGAHDVDARLAETALCFLTQSFQ
jgi:hypothetical protein